ncbi:isopenicillin N synthase family oxygenase [Kaistia dalseonensis]|uniref:2-oxoglutarate-dependent ethylene/succinate-forming enzyme n=1 Tax=Kaistia dalseonensis TaxID=410840 RepID=A0ABU0H8V8_9HYPH|nr:2-oxoglutarate and iron-dependent oxygenase domain-containing protein [Kaistia dalseonensis]MCX5496148.1 isopenicillin N synthase family oxygenase [Kaistia dalseonensis]MDQ0438757.1 isopenicillin N synthase-like dioxygenase [Kaistia dalseonensis]
MKVANLPRAYEKAQTVDVSDIPIIDFEPFLTGGPEERAAVAAAIGQACEEVGFFYLANHGVPQDLIDRTFAVSAGYYAQPFPERMKSAATLEHWRGYVPSKLEAEGGTVGGAIETYRFMLDLPPDDPDVLAGKPLHLPNRWPEGQAAFKPTVEAYFDAVMTLSGHLRAAFAMALGLPEDYFEPFYQKPVVQLSLLHYRPPVSLREEDLEIGAGEHRDTGAFTLLMQDDTGGLEVERKDGVWIGAPPVKGAYVINIGNVMMKWTNGRFVSTPHRVVNRALRPRYSIPFFANPDYDVTIAPIPEIMKPGETPQFEAFENGSYMADFYKMGMAYLMKNGEKGPY